MTTKWFMWRLLAELRTIKSLNKQIQTSSNFPHSKTDCRPVWVRNCIKLWNSISLSVKEVIQIYKTSFAKILIESVTEQCLWWWQVLRFDSISSGDCWYYLVRWLNMIKDQATRENSHLNRFLDVKLHSWIIWPNPKTFSFAWNWKDLLQIR